MGRRVEAHRSSEYISYSTATKQGTKITHGVEKSTPTVRKKHMAILDMASKWVPRSKAINNDYRSVFGKHGCL